MSYALALSMLALMPRLLCAFPVVSFEQQTLDAALMLAGLDRANLPVTLVTIPPASASHGIEGWTSYDAHGAGERIFIYAGSDIFRCAQWPLGMRQCRIRLASVLVHEAWHLAHGPHEGDAYEAQITFLMRNGASTEHVKAVRLAQNRVLAAERRATTDARR